MNIFILDTDMKKNEIYHPDKHIVKMPLESAQLLCSAYYYGYYIPDNCYKLTPRNHPCAICTRESLNNWLWLWRHTFYLEKNIRTDTAESINQ